MKQYIQNFKKFQPLLEELVARDIKIKYRRSVLGVLWTLLNPLLMMIVLSVVFSNLFKFDVENFPLFILFHQAFGQLHSICGILGIAVRSDLIRIFLGDHGSADNDFGGDTFLFRSGYDLPHSLHGGGHQR